MKFANASTAPTQSVLPPRRKKILARCAVTLTSILLVLLAGGALVAHKLQPLLRARLLQTFQERFHSAATLQDVQVHYTGQIQVDGRGLQVQSVLNGVPGDPRHPMLRVQEFHFHLSLFQALSRSPRIHHVRIRGVYLELPPQSAQQSETFASQSEVDLEYAEVDDAHVRFSSSAPDHAPLQFDLPHLAFRGVSRSRPIRFHAVVDNGPPLGITETDGTIGPWDFDDPRLTPIQGSFAFQNKDLSSVHGLRGRLTLNGRYQGTVGSMHAEGTTDDPAFALDVSSHPLHLHTSFAMTLQPAESRVSLERVQGSFGQTVFVCQGDAIKDGAADSFRLDVQLSTSPARVEDALALAMRAEQPVLRGGLALKGRLQMRAGPDSVFRKLQMPDATFSISGASFSNGEAQQMFDELAERAQGNAKDATSRRAISVTANAHGTVRLSNAVLRFPRVIVEAPGSQSTLHGTYSLSGTEFAFDGNVHTEAKMSHMTTGVKSLLLKPFNGLFSRPGANGATLPLHIQGVGGGVPHLRTRVAGIRIAPPGSP